MLEGHDLTFFYRGRKKTPVIDGLDLTISPGERVGCAGKSSWTADRSVNTAVSARCR